MKQGTKMVVWGLGLGLSLLVMKIGFCIPNHFFGVAIILMICAGASEMSMAQWASAFAESALGLTKSVGDLAGPCLFAITMGIARVLYGKFGDKIDLTKFMQVSGVLCVLSYLFVGLSAMPILGLIGCIICGFSVGIMWPGSISITVPRIPKGGTALFALLAVAGDMGGALGPSMVGYFSQQAGDNLQTGLLMGCIFPLIMLAALIAMRKMARKDKYCGCANAISPQVSSLYNLIRKYYRRNDTILL